MRAFETMNKPAKEEDWEWAMDAASTAFDESHELPSQAHPRDREEWGEAMAEKILKERGFDV